MKRWMYKAEKIVDDALPLLLVLFILVVALEVLFPEETKPFQDHIDLFDTILILVFASDLFFKYERMHNFKKFLSKYWLQIIAIIPFYAVFRMLEYLELADLASRGGKFVNQTQFMRGPALLIREAEKVEGISRTEKLLKFKPLSRFPKLIDAIPYFEKPTGKHHNSKKKK
ncbi:hypothetical protein HYU11_02325 [Candidatus Woesearchaeota archaeon]|nr:hypothetical protein [Candidatus Woesearchaeota archaeon]